jgi:hypothetical protein
MIQNSFHVELEQVFYRFPKCHIKILLGAFNAKLGTRNIFKLTIGNESLHQNGKDNGFRTVNFATSKNLGLKSMMFPHQNIINTPGPLLIGRLKTKLTHIDRQEMAFEYTRCMKSQGTVILITIWWLQMLWTYLQ